MPVPPLKCISILLCERVYRVARTRGNVIITNGFHILDLSAFPCRFGPITVLYTVTDGHGDYDMRLTLTEAATGNEVGQWKGRQKMPDPLMVADVVMVLPRVRFPQPGKYLFDLSCNGEVIATRPFYVNKLIPKNARAQKE